MLGMPVKPYRISLLDIDYVAVKAPMFSFTRLRGADPTLGECKIWYCIISISSNDMYMNNQSMVA